MRVVDDATGAPIIGARVLAIDEARAPVWGEVWFTAEASTNAEGRAAIPPEAEGADHDWIMVQAEGYGAVGESSYSAKEPLQFRLKPETPITIELVDFLGRPLPLAHLGVAFGCGHTPDLVNAVTGRDGRATLPGVTDYRGRIEDLYFVHPEVSMLGYDTVPYDDVKGGAARVYADPGFVLTGCILLPNGKPAVGYSVGNDQTHRGHWARTDQNGEFRLFGCEPQTDYLSVVTPGVERKTFFHGARQGVYRTLQLDGTDQPETYVDGQEGTKLPMSELRVQLSVPEPEGRVVPERLRWIPVVVWSPETGLALWHETNEAGSLSLSIPPGHYFVEAGGPNSPYRAQLIGSFTAPSGGSPEPIQVGGTLPAPRVTSLKVLGLTEKAGLDIMTAAGYYTRYDLKGENAREPHFLLPSGRWSAFVEREEEDGNWRRIDAHVPREIGRELTLRLTE